MKKMENIKSEFPLIKKKASGKEQQITDFFNKFVSTDQLLAVFKGSWQDRVTNEVDGSMFRGGEGTNLKPRTGGWSDNR